MNNCSKFITCSCNLCPLDPDVSRRGWIVGEEFCKNKDFKSEPWVLRQRKLNRIAPASLLGTLLSLEYLTSTAPKKRILSPEHKAKLIEAGRLYRLAK